MIELLGDHARWMSEPGPFPTGDLLNLVEQLSNFDRIGVTRLARHLGVPVPTAIGELVNTVATAQ